MSPLYFTDRLAISVSPMAATVRLGSKCSESLVLDHYLETLASKPGALAGATALVAANKSRTFTAEHDSYLAAARRHLGDKPGNLRIKE